MADKKIKEAVIVELMAGPLDGKKLRVPLTKLVLDQTLILKPEAPGSGRKHIYQSYGPVTEDMKQVGKELQLAHAGVDVGMC